jgi:hypothetical protein
VTARPVAHTVYDGFQYCTNYTRALHSRAALRSPSMEHATLETAALAHVNDEYYYGAYCGQCKHSARLSLVKLRERLGDSFPLIDVRLKLRCRRCRSRHIIITFLTPDHCTGSLGKLFDLPVS